MQGIVYLGHVSALIYLNLVLLMTCGIVLPETVVLSVYGSRLDLSLPGDGVHSSPVLNECTCLTHKIQHIFGCYIYFFSMILIKSVDCFETSGTGTLLAAQVPIINP